MGFRSFFVKPLVHYFKTKDEKLHLNPNKVQKQVFQYLIKKATLTQFGEAHHFNKIQSVKDYQKAVPIRDYEDIKPYINKILKGEKDVLWQDLPTYFAKTSGTTSGAKYIPITKASIPNHINTARNALFSYIAHTGNASFLDGNMMFLSGSPVLNKSGIIPTGRLSGIVNHHVPAILKINQLPAWQTNCEEDWETKIHKIVKETVGKDLRLISGIPPWVQMFLDKVMNVTQKSIDEVFPNLQLFIHGGVNYLPYKNKLEATFNKPVDTLETFPASEGFFAFQRHPEEEGLLLNINSGIFFEFVPLEEFYNKSPTRLTVEQIELDKNYALIISSNAGLWSYSIGDTVKFVAKNPLRLVVSGRVAAQQNKVKINEFTVAPQVQTQNELPYHEWFIEFDEVPKALTAFALSIDEQLQQQNSYYKDLIQGKVLQPLKITIIPKGGFANYMQSIGKLGGQNKVPRLSNNRDLIERLIIS